MPATFSIAGGQYVVSGSEDAKIYIWDLQSRKILQVLDGHRGACLIPNRVNSHHICQPDTVLSIAVRWSVLLSIVFTYCDYRPTPPRLV